MRLELYPFEYFDEKRKRWVRARFKSRIEVIKTYPQHRIVGESEVREVADDPAERFPTAPG